MNRYIFIVPLVLLTIVQSFAQSTGKPNQVITTNILENAFNNVLQKIETEESACWSVKVIIGDLNSDGINDGLVYYACGFKAGGNAVAGSGLAIFINIDGKPIYKGAYDEIVGFIPKKIISGLIHGEILEYGPDDARCCPSISKPTILKFTNNKLVISSPSSVTNKVYNTVKIGNQVWMTKNLDVSTFRNGDPIPQAKTNEEWEKAGDNKQPAWCYYENDPANGAKYGKLYNWYAVSDSRGLAPIGYHIPSDAEWTILTDYLGGEQKAGAKMKSQQGWAEDGNGTNSSGFSGLPGGYRSTNGTFYNVGKNGFWWSYTEYNTGSAWYRYLDYDYGSVYRNFNDKGKGFSVRCLRD